MGPSRHTTTTPQFRGTLKTMAVDRQTVCLHLKNFTAWAVFTAKPSSVEFEGGHVLNCAQICFAVSNFFQIQQFSVTKYFNDSFLSTSLPTTIASKPPLLLKKMTKQLCWQSSRRILLVHRRRNCHWKWKSYYSNIRNLYTFFGGFFFLSIEFPQWKRMS